jgi:hypothetical protein
MAGFRRRRASGYLRPELVYGRELLSFRFW